MFAHCNDQRRSLTVYDIAPAPQQGQFIATRMFCFCSSSRSARSSICRACCWNSSCSERLEHTSWSSTARSLCEETTGAVRIDPDALRFDIPRADALRAPRCATGLTLAMKSTPVLVSVPIDPDLYKIPVPRTTRKQDS